MLHTFLCISNTFISNTRLKLAKNEAIAKHPPDAERLKFKNYLHSSSTVSTKNILREKKWCLFSRDYMTNCSENEDAN